MAVNSGKEPSVEYIRKIVRQAAEGKQQRNKIAALIVLIAALAILLLFFMPSAPVPIDTCSNGILDDEEEGIDCGGVCPEQCTEYIDPFYVKPVSVSDAAVNLSANRIYLLDETRHRLMIYDGSFNHIGNIGETRELSEAGWSYSSGGTANSQFLFPAAIALDSDGQLYVLDRANRIQVFSKDGEFVRAMRFEENVLNTLPRMLDAPHIDGAALSIAIAPDGKIYVSDEASSVVALFSPDLKLAKSIGGRGSGNAQLIFPGQVSYSNGKVYVADSGNSRVQVFDSELNYLASITNSLKQPAAIAVADSGQIYVMDNWDNKLKVFDSSYGFVAEKGELGRLPGMFYNAARIKVDSDGKPYIVETGNVRVQVLDSSLETVASMQGMLGGTLTGFTPFYVAVSSDGTIAISESLNNRVSLFNQSGRYIKSIGAKGFNDGEFNIPKGLAFDSQGRLFVADAWNHRIEVFSKDLRYVASIKHPQLFWPVAIAVAPDGTIYVGEDSSKKVLMFDKRGNYIGAIDEGKGITLPLGILATADRLIITDDKEKTIEVFDSKLKKIGSISGIDEKTGVRVEFNESLALDKSGNLLFADNRNRKIVSYNFSTGEFSLIGEFGEFAGYELSVMEVAASTDGKLIAVTDLAKQRLLLFDESYRQIKEITINDFPE